MQYEELWRNFRLNYRFCDLFQSLMEFNYFEGKNRMTFFKFFKFIKYLYSTIYSTLCRTLSYLSRLSSLLFLPCNNNKTSLPPCRNSLDSMSQENLAIFHWEYWKIRGFVVSTFSSFKTSKMRLEFIKNYCTHCKYLNAWFECNDIVIFV